MKKVLIIFITAIFLFFQCVGTCEGAAYSNQKEKKTRFRYTETHQLRAIETYRVQENDCEELLSVERFKWHPEFGYLTELTLEDNQENVLIHQTLDYDSEGRPFKETAWRSEGGPLYARHYSRDGYTWEVPLEETSCTDIFLDGIGYCPIPHEIGMHKGENSPEKARITFINGILNNKKDLLKSIGNLSRLHGNTSIHYVFKPSEGFTWDFLRSSLIKFGHVTPQAEGLAELWKSLIVEMGGVESEGVIYHYAHSSGGSNTYLARFLLTPEEQKMIKVITLGSPTVIPNEGFRSVLNYMSISDIILYLDPVSHLKALLGDESHVIYVGEDYGFSFEDHILEGKSYNEVLGVHGKEFVDFHYPAP